MIKSTYYHLRPLIPRSAQIALRRMVINLKRRSCADVWPIDEKAGKPPEGFSGWPEKKKFAVVLTHDVETAKGQEKCHELAKLEEELGFKSSFNFVPKRYSVSPELRRQLTGKGFEVGLHGLYHDGKLYNSKKIFQSRAKEINDYIKEWEAKGFRSPSMHNNLEWIHDLNIEYDSSTFDTDPFEPESEGVGTIFPFLVSKDSTSDKGYIELPYTLPQDFTLFVLMKERNINIWKKKLDWIVEKGGMVLITTHPDYMNFGDRSLNIEEYPVEYYSEFLNYIKEQYKDQYWNVLPMEVARSWSKRELNVKKHYLKKNKKDHMRICMLAYTYYEMDNRVRRYAETLAKRGDKVDVIALKRPGQAYYEKLKGVNVYRIQRRILNEKQKLTYLFKITAFLFNSFFFLMFKNFKEGYDLVHVHSVPDFEVFSALVPKMMGTKIILDIHDIVPEFYAGKFHTSKKSILFKLLLFVEKISISFSHHVIIANHLWEERLISRSVKKDKCTTILNYPDSDLFYEYKKTNNKDKFVMVYPGTLNEHQGLDVAIKAFAIIKNEIPEAELHLYGDGPSKNALVDLASELSVEERVLFLGSIPLDEIGSVMADSDLGIVPKKAESFGNEAYSTKILEFMAVGVPLIISRTKIDEYYFDESLVKFFKSGDEKHLAECILLLKKDEKLREQLIKNSLKYIEKNSWDVKKNIYLDLVDSLVGKE